MLKFTKKNMSTSLILVKFWKCANKDSLICEFVRYCFKLYKEKVLLTEPQLKVEIEKMGAKIVGLPVGILLHEIARKCSRIARKFHTGHTIARKENPLALETPSINKSYKANVFPISGEKTANCSIHRYQTNSKKSAKWGPGEDWDSMF